MMILFFLIATAFSQSILYSIESSNNKLLFVDIDRSQNKNLNHIFNIGDEYIQIQTGSDGMLTESYWCHDSVCSNGKVITGHTQYGYGISHYDSKYCTLHAKSGDVTLKFYPANQWTRNKRFTCIQTGVMKTEKLGSNIKLSYIIPTGGSKGDVTNVEIHKDFRNDINDYYDYKLGDKNVYHAITSDEFRNTYTGHGQYIFAHRTNDNDITDIETYHCTDSCTKLNLKSFKDLYSEASNQLQYAYYCLNGKCVDDSNSLKFHIGNSNEKYPVLVDNSLMMMSKDAATNFFTKDEIEGRYREDGKYENSNGDLFLLKTPPYDASKVSSLYSSSVQSSVEFVAGKTFRVDGKYVRYARGWMLGRKSSDEYNIVQMVCKQERCEDVSEISIVGRYDDSKEYVSPKLVLFSHESSGNCGEYTNKDYYMRKEVIGSGGYFFGESYDIELFWAGVSFGDSSYDCDACFERSYDEMYYNKYIYLHCGAFGTTLLALLLLIVFLF